MGDTMIFPDTVEEFMEGYKIVDSKQIYTNGIKMIPIFRMEQWFEHLPSTKPEIVRCKNCKYCDRGIDEDGNPFLKCLGWVYGGTQEEDFCSHAERRIR